MQFPALSTGHFNKYERKSKWLEYILPISDVVLKVQCKKGKTVTPSRKLQAKGEIACMYDSRLSSSLLRNIPSDSLTKGEAFTLQTGKRHQYKARFYQSPLFNDKNAFRKSVYIYKYYFPDFSCTHRRMCVYGRYAPGFFNLVDQSYHESSLDPVH